MIYFVVWNETGRIIWTGFVSNPKDIQHQQLAPGQTISIVESEGILSSTHYFEDDELKERPVLVVPESFNATSGEKCSIDLPDQTKVAIGFHEILVSAGEMDFSDLQPGQYDAIAEAWPYKPARTKFVVQTPTTSN